MNWNKCMKNFNCKVCSDYNYCKDDIKNTKSKKSKKTRRQTCIKIGSDKDGFKHKTRKIYSKHS